MGGLLGITQHHLGDRLCPKIIILLEYPPPSLVGQRRENVKKDLIISALRLFFSFVVLSFISMYYTL